MVTLNAHFDGKAIVLDDPVSPPLKAGAKLRLNIETVDDSPSPAHAPGGFKPLNIDVSTQLSNSIALDRWFGGEES